MGLYRIIAQLRAVSRRPGTNRRRLTRDRQRGATMLPDRERPEAWRGRVGLIIPSSNRLSELQLARHATPGLQFHTTRLRMTGDYHAPPSEIMDRIRGAAAMLADAKVNLIVFHCTGSSMEEGPGADERIAAAIREETGIPATTTATAIVAALRTLA